MEKSAEHQRDRSESRRVPLRGKTILITRARQQSDEMTSALEALGAIVVHCPTIEVVPSTDLAQLDASIRRIDEYDWLIFTSANGVHFFFSRLLEIRTDGVKALEGCVICAIGPATSRALQKAGAIANVTASDSKAEGALLAIIDHVGGEQNVSGLRFLLPRARVARETLPDGLRKLGALVDAVEAYQTVKPDLTRESVLRLFNKQSIDVITFTSSSTVSNFAALVGISDLSEFLAKSLVACIGPVTAETAASYGLKNIIQPDQYNSQALVELIVRSIGKV